MNQFVVLKNKEEIFAYQSSWDLLYSKILGINFFSFDFVISGNDFLEKEKKYLFDSLYIILVKTKKGNEIEAIFPFFIDRKKTLRFICDLNLDFCDCLIEKNKNYSWWRSFFQFLLNGSDFSRMDLDNILPSSSFLNNARHFLGEKVLITSYNEHSFFQKDKSTDPLDLFKHLKSDIRSEHKRVLKKMPLIQHEIFVVAKQAFPINELLNLKTNMIESNIRSKDFLTTSFLELCRSLYNQEKLEISCILDDENTLLAASLVLINPNNMSKLIWVDLYKPEKNINIISYIHFLKNFASGSYNSVSFGRGIYKYKCQNFDPELQSLFNVRYSKKIISLYFRFYYPIKTFVKAIVKNK